MNEINPIAETSEYSPNYFIRIEKDLDEILTPVQHILDVAIPAFHRVQHVFGPLEERVPQEFLSDVAYDLVSFIGLDTLSALQYAQQTMEALDKSYVALLDFYLTRTFVTDRITSDTDRETFYALIARIVYRSWTSLGARERGVSLPESLMKLSYANLTYFRIHAARARRSNKELPFSFSSERPDLSDQEYSSWNFVMRDLGARGYYAPAETTVLDQETFEELQELSRRFYIGELLTGSELPDLELINLELVSLCKHGVEIYGWSQKEVSAVINYVLRYLSEPAVSTPDTFPTNRIWEMLSGRMRDLSALFCAIDELPDLQKLCILKVLKYIEPTQNLNGWLGTVGISKTTFDKHLKIAFATVLRIYESPQYPVRSMGSIVSTLNTQWDRDSRGSYNIYTDSGQRSRVGQIVELRNSGVYTQGSVSASCRALLEALEGLYGDGTGREPTYSELAEFMGVSKSVVKSNLLSLLQYPGHPFTYATKDTVIGRASQWSAVIHWSRTRLPDERLELQLLTPQLRAVYGAATQLTPDGYYPNYDEIHSAALELGFDVKNVSVSLDVIAAKLSRPPMDIYTLNKNCRNLSNFIFTPNQHEIAQVIAVRLFSGRHFAHGYLNELVEETGFAKGTVRIVMQMLLTSRHEEYQ